MHVGGFSGRHGNRLCVRIACWLVGRFIEVEGLSNKVSSTLSNSLTSRLITGCWGCDNGYSVVLAVGLAVGLVVGSSMSRDSVVGLAVRWAMNTSVNWPMGVVMDIVMVLAVDLTVGVVVGAWAVGLVVGAVVGLTGARRSVVVLAVGVLVGLVVLRRRGSRFGGRRSDGLDRR